jgi:hypothetical protein
LSANRLDLGINLIQRDPVCPLLNGLALKTGHSLNSARLAESG